VNLSLTLIGYCAIVARAKGPEVCRAGGAVVMSQDPATAPFIVLAARKAFDEGFARRGTGRA
jgi:hypothetical protein